MSPVMALVDLRQLYTLILCADRMGCSSWECTLTSMGGAKVSKSEGKRKIRPFALCLEVMSRARASRARIVDAGC
ncbi:uncharacterized, partial [Lates japonicus]